MLSRPADVGAFVFLTFLLWNLNANMVFCAHSVVVARHYIIVNDLEIIDKMYCVWLLKCVQLVLFRSTDVGAFIFLNLAVVKFNANIVFVTCSLSVVQQVPLKLRKRTPKQDLWVVLHLIINVDVTTTDRCVRIYVFTLFFLPTLSK